jgi:(5-formylfuran-3-yl)methyl phosphate synthase
MTLFLASVRDDAEAEMAIGAGVDIVDLKDPSRGALGALRPETIAACVRAVGSRLPVSATIGDLPLEAPSIRAAILMTAALGVDYIKLGLFPGKERECCLKALATLTARIRLILVAFADALPEGDIVELAARIGASGVMFDTLGKGGASLLELIPAIRLAALVRSARERGLTIGFAGSLRASQVSQLLTCQPDLLGFRSALCRDGKRSEPLDPVRVAVVRGLIPENAGLVQEAKLTAPSQRALC